LRDYGHDAQIGLEPNLETYVAAVVTVFREVWRVLKDDGTIWVNLGDGYDAGTRATRCPSASAGKHGYWTNPLINLRTSTDMGPKQMLAIPWRVALALQSDGWILRSEIIYEKPACLPESVKDRPTTAHEHLFLLAKSRAYYYDADAIKEPASLDTHARYARGRSASHKYADGGPGDQTIARSLKHMAGVNPKSLLGEHGNKQNASFSASVKDVVEDRNKRTIWRINHPGYSGAHFATFPEGLVEPCVLAGSRHGDLVLDPFLGSGTVGAVAERLDRRWVGVDLTYQDLSATRTAQRGLRFSQETA
jgi:site-specific DNA-methyltransferase (cytosine-N4-specific)